MASSMAASPIDLLPRLRERAFQEALRTFDAADLGSPAGRERIVHDLSRAIVRYERKHVAPEAGRMPLRRIEAIIRVSLQNLVAASCA
jgi:hypothetical protein